MIEFYGVLSEECKNVRERKISKQNGVLFLIITIVVSIVTICIGIINDTWYYAIALIGIFIVITVFAFCLPRFRKGFLQTKVPTRIIIENNTISITAVGGSNGMNTKSIKKIIDRGAWYDIIFKFGDMSNSWVCQKDLITKGTIEEFEKLFVGKIDRKMEVK